MDYTYHGPLQEYIYGLVQEKHALGYSYKTDEKHLAQFDRFCMRQCPNAQGLTKKLVLKWAQCRSSEHAAGLDRRILPVRELGRYIQRLGIPSYILPTNFVRRNFQYTPHIYTHAELKAFFLATDNLQYNHRCPARHYVVPVIFRMLYCCGLRPFEAVMLKISDVCLESGTVFIRESKGHKDRTVVLSDDMLALCRRYREVIKSIFPANEYFFPNRGAHYTRSHISILFGQLWMNSGNGKAAGNPPRVYDFRHTFATHRLYKWLKDGNDLYACLPYLSAFMGHESFEDTAYYIHLVPEYFSQLSEMHLEQFEHILPEVDNENS